MPDEKKPKRATLTADLERLCACDDALRWVKRFADKTRVLDSGCHEWTGHVEKNGYGRFYLDGRMRWAHRVAYQAARGPVPAGLELDHTCRNTRCVNVLHLEAVTHAENMRRARSAGAGGGAASARRTHCPQGHAYDDANTYLYRGMRYCRACHRGHSEAHKRRLRDAMKGGRHA